jgi:hypothetical protein
MKTTVEIPDALLIEAKQLAASQHTTVRALIEQGLQRVLVERKGRAVHRLRQASFAGEGLQPDDVREGAWERLRELAYEGRGG